MSPCGTRSAYTQGCRCDRCKAACRDYMRRRRGSVITTPLDTRKGVHIRAMQRLIDRHLDEYNAIVEDEAARVALRDDH